MINAQEILGNLNVKDFSWRSIEKLTDTDDYIIADGGD